jgi:hypothetical protein
MEEVNLVVVILIFEVMDGRGAKRDFTDFLSLNVFFNLQ